MAEKKLRIAIVGCGAVTELSHLPAAALVQDITVTALVDKNRTRAQQLAERFGVQHALEDCQKLPELADGAILAVPHSLHAPMSIDLMSRGVHVLVEKPMAVTTDECDAMDAAARKAGVILAVGLVRRFLRPNSLVKYLLEHQILGPVESFDMEEGSVYNWPSASSFILRRESAGGGVLIGTGSHALDLALWWLGEPESLEYYDDNHGGIEAECRLEMVMRSKARATVILSRLRKLRNSTIIQCEKGQIEVWPFRSQIQVVLKEPGLRLVSEISLADEAARSQPSSESMMAAQLIDWHRAIAGRTPPLCNAAEGRRSVALIESCYAKRQAIQTPWMTAHIPASA